MSEYRDVRSQIATVAERWKNQHWNGCEWESTISGSSREIYERLSALDTNIATPMDVADIIGNELWVGEYCDECGERLRAYMRLGEDPDYEGHTVFICRPCLVKALDAWPEFPTVHAPDCDKVEGDTVAADLLCTCCCHQHEGNTRCPQCAVHGGEPDVDIERAYNHVMQQRIANAVRSPLTLGHGDGCACIHCSAKRGR